MQEAVNIIHREKSRTAEDYRHGINFVKVVLTGIKNMSELFGSASGQEINRVGHR